MNNPNRRAFVMSLAAVVVAVTLTAARPSAQNGTVPPPAPGTATKAVTPPPIPLPPGYVIGPGDVLTIDFWETKEISGDVTVRPDGKITLRAIGEIQAAGLTPDELDKEVTKRAMQFLKEEPTVAIVVKQIFSRNVSITGEINKPGVYSLTQVMTVIDLVSLAGGLTSYAKKDNITLIRMENGKAKPYRVNYEEVSEGKKLEQDKVLMPGDRIIVR
jgi:polysaccharide export outer membrane protein